LLDVDVEEGLNRRRIGGGEWNRLDAQQLAFHQRVRQGYLAMAAEDPARWRVINARQKPDLVQKDIQAVLLQKLQQK
jgi:dTMP kinase